MVGVGANSYTRGGVCLVNVKSYQLELRESPRPGRWRLPVALMAALLLLAGCRTKSLPQKVGPHTAFDTRYQFGTPLSGPQAAGRTLKASPDLVVQAEFLKLDRWPAVNLPSLAGQSTISVNNAASRPTMAIPALSVGAQFGNVNDSSTFFALLHSAGIRFAVCGQGAAAVWPGMSVAMRLTDAHGLRVHGQDLRQLLALWVWQGQAPAGKAAPMAGLAFEIKRFNPTSGLPTLVRQLQVLPERAFTAKTTFGAILPFHFVSGHSPAFAVLITIRRWTNSPQDQALAKQCRGQLAASLNLHHPVLHLNRPDLLVALYHLGTPGVRRAALVYLAGQTGARLTQDVAAVAQPPVLRALAQAVAAHTLHAPRMTLAQLGWTLDKTTYTLLYQAQKTKPLSPQLMVALGLHLGEAAWHVSSLDEIARALTSRRTYRLRIIKENLIYLEDSSPGRRKQSIQQRTIPVGLTPHKQVRPVGHGTADIEPTAK